MHNKIVTIIMSCILLFLPLSAAAEDEQAMPFLIMPTPLLDYKFGHGKISIPSLQLSTNIILSNIQLSTKQQQKSNKTHAVISLYIGNINFNQKQSGPLQLHLALSNIDNATWKFFLIGVRELFHAKRITLDQTINQINKINGIFLELIKKNMEVELEITAPKFIVKNITLHFIYETLLEKANNVNYYKNITPQKRLEISKKLSHQILKNLIERGFLIEKNHAYKTKIQYHKNSLIVNRIDLHDPYNLDKLYNEQHNYNTRLLQRITKPNGLTQQQIKSRLLKFKEMMRVLNYYKLFVNTCIKIHGNFKNCHSGQAAIPHYKNENGLIENIKVRNATITIVPKVNEHLKITSQDTLIAKPKRNQQGLIVWEYHGGAFNNN